MVNNIDNLFISISGLAFINKLVKIDLVSPSVMGIYFTEELSSEENSILDEAVLLYRNKELSKTVEGAITAAKEFGSKLVLEFSAENILLGITQAGMTGEVIQKLTGVLGAIQTGSLYEAINLLKAVPPEDYDATFITTSRLLSFCNKIEAYLGLPLSTEI